MPEGKASKHWRMYHIDIERTINSNIHNISTGSSGGDHAGGSDTCSVVGVNVNRKVRILRANRANQAVELLALRILLVEQYH